MRVMTARVVEGKIDVGDAEIREGAAVAVLIPDAAGFALSEDDETALELALAEIQEGQYMDGRELIRELKGLAGR
jgi:dihydroxyacetone kinase